MGNANSTPAKPGNAGSNEASFDPALKRYSSNQIGHGRPNTSNAADAGVASPSAAARQIAYRSGSGPRMGRTASLFGRASSHDGATTPQRNRSRSGSLSGYLAAQRRGSVTAAMIAGDAPATVKEGREPPTTDNGSAYSPSTRSRLAKDPQTPFAGYEISNTAKEVGTDMETAIRTNLRTRRLTEGLAMPSSPGGFDPRNFVSTHPSPSVATQAHYASGLPSHHASVGVSSGLRVSSTGLDAEAVPAMVHRGSEPQTVPGATVRAPTRHPLFGVGGTSMFTNVGTSLGTNAAASPPVGGSSPIMLSQPMNLGDGGEEADGPHRPPAALPSYLKIPTAIPSSHVSPSSPPASIYSQHSDRYRAPSEPQRSRSPSLMLSVDDTRPAHAVAAAGAAAAVLNTEDVLIAPGDASKASSPIEGRRSFFGAGRDEGKDEAAPLDTSIEEARAAGIDVTDLPGSPAQASEAKDAQASRQTEDGERESRKLERASLEAGDGAPLDASRTPTPTPSGYRPRALTPTRKGGASVLRSFSPVAGPSTSMGPPSQPISARRSHVDVQTGGESGYNTPLLPPGLTSAPPSASVPGVTPLSEVSSSSPTTEHARGCASDAPRTPSAAGSVGNNSQPSTPVSAKPGSVHQTDSQHAQTSTDQQQPPLMPIVLTWRADGREVFVTGTFANEWRSKILLHKVKRDHTCVLHLPPGTHRLKFIVDGRWRVSRDLPTATDGDGNLVNYVEIPNVGPAHPGPLSAPGEDLPGADADKNRSERNSKIESKKTTMNLVEEARRAEAMRLDDLFDDDGKDQEETWTCEIPTALIKAQEAEEAQREAEESGQAQFKHTQHHGSDGTSGAPLPQPPALPRQLEKVILNSSPANPSNGTTSGSTVDDNSILPAPNHVVLNHLTASSIKGGVLAVGTTTRYKRKYVTTVYYRPVQV
ncbi:related to SIP2-subunit of the Snf1 serine/threonine protein kinase complex [Ustilago bromivora]|uniref:Related to SIP2 - subunit of the Snf1 serine/threonine protein kinase complex n=1 Tax=Ustilago bromivora TaxID=307758 RepID=A0A1K0FV10_9BASI|nr:related to SIP2-subunit of the Snf1 serine/threonine protein kinase complex [Ustilago bromivora]SYW77355.1 related to SIP2 - subunit of the Snf1 serine/threonine protein kinase complex [Ustilago bromivora]